MTNTNKSTITVVTSTIALLAFLCVFTICLLSYYEIKVGPELNTLTAALVGALSAMLVKTSPTETVKEPTAPPSPTNPTPVQVMNEPTDPVPTTEESK